jgi:hypothetical protein
VFNLENLYVFSEKNESGDEENNEEKKTRDLGVYAIHAELYRAMREMRMMRIWEV